MGVILYAFEYLFNCYVVSSLYLKFGNDVVNIKAILMGKLYFGTACIFQISKLLEIIAIYNTALDRYQQTFLTKHKLMHVAYNIVLKIHGHITVKLG